MNKTLITEAALAVLATSGTQVIQSYLVGGFTGINAIALGTFAAGLVALVQRHRQKKADDDLARQVMKAIAEDSEVK